MASDAKFEDGGEAPLRLRAMSAEDLDVISALTQDSVGKVANIQYMPARRRFSLLIYRFRWEDRERASAEKRPFERVAAALTIDDALHVRVAGIDRKDSEAVLNILGLVFQPEEDGAGKLRITCSGGAAIEMDVECLNISLVDLTRPWETGKDPQHS